MSDPLSDIARSLDRVRGVLEVHASVVGADPQVLARTEPQAYVDIVQGWEHDLDDILTALDELRFGGEWVLMRTAMLPMEEGRD